MGRDLAPVLLAAQLLYVLKPVDEALRDPSLVAARSEAVAALQAGSVERFLAVVDRKASLGDWGDNEDEVRRRLESDRAPRAWHPTVTDEIVKALSLGGAFRSVYGERQFCAPYVYGAYPQSFPRWNDADPPVFAVLNPDVAVKAEPDPASATIARLGQQLVEVANTGDPIFGRDRRYWYPVYVRNGKKGFVPVDDLRSPEDYHVCFAKRDGQWKIVTIMNHEFPPGG